MLKDCQGGYRFLSFPEPFHSLGLGDPWAFRAFPPGVLGPGDQIACYFLLQVWALRSGEGGAPGTPLPPADWAEVEGVQDFAKGHPPRDPLPPRQDSSS